MRNYLSPRLLALLSALFCLHSAHAEIAVIAHPGNPIKALSSRAASDLYLGRSRTLGNEPVLILDLSNDNPVRSRFFQQLNGMDLRRVNAYWARLQFSGDMQPPVQLHNCEDVIEVVRNNRHAIGYIDAAKLPAENVRVLLRLPE